MWEILSLTARHTEDGDEVYFRCGNKNLLGEFKPELKVVTHQKTPTGNEVVTSYYLKDATAFEKKLNALFAEACKELTS